MQANSWLHDILTRPLKPLWLHLLRELDDFTQPSLSDDYFAPEPSDLPSDALRELVFKAHRFRSNWTQRRGPRALRTRRIDLNNRGGFFSAVIGIRNGELNENRPGIKFTRGCDGRYVTLIWSSGYFQVWDIHEAACIWTYPQLGDFASDAVLACDSEVVPAESVVTKRITLALVIRSTSISQ